MKNIRALLAAFLAVVAAGAQAVTFSTDVSDLWSNPAEQGWGINVVQQGDTVFATIFVNAPDQAPVWYVASNAAYVAQPGSSFVFEGPLYQVAAPWFGGVFDPNAVQAREVGTLRLEFFSITQALVTYKVDGRTIAKNVGRQTWRTNDLSGEYLGAAIGIYSGCGAQDGYAEELAEYSVRHDSKGISITLVRGAASCTYSGVYLQSGRMGTVNGAINCGGTPAGTFVAAELEGSITAFTGRAQTRQGACTWSGRIGGLRRG